MDEAERLTKAIREKIERHDNSGQNQWYVDEFVIDCYADEFWSVTLQALREALKPEVAPEP